MQFVKTIFYFLLVQALIIRAMLPSKLDPFFQLHVGDGDSMQIVCALKGCLHGDRVTVAEGLP